MGSAPIYMDPGAGPFRTFTAQREFESPQSSCLYPVFSQRSSKLKMLPATFKLCAGISYRHMRNMTGE